MPITDATADDLEIVAAQLGRVPRGVVGIAARHDSGAPTVVATQPRLADGSPFPTTFYLTDTGAVKAASTLEAEHCMDMMSDALGENEELADSYACAHEAYLTQRTQLGHVPEIENVSAGGMPARIKCLHALIGHSLAAGPGVNPVGDWALYIMYQRNLWQVPADFRTYFAGQLPSWIAVSQCEEPTL